MQLKKIVLLSFLGVVGCSTVEPRPDPDVDIVTTFDTIEPRNTYWRLSVADSNFSYTIDYQGIPSFKQRNPNMTLDDLVDFVRVRCLNEILYPKMEKGEPISKDEALLLKFCLDVQSTMVQAIGDSFAWDILGKEEEFVSKQIDYTSDIPQMIKREVDVLKPLSDSYINRKGASSVREKIRKYGVRFKNVDTMIKLNLYISITKEGNLYNIEPSKIQKFCKQHPYFLLLDPKLSAVRDGLLLADYTVQHYSKTDCEKAAESIDVIDNMGKEWLSLSEITKEYLKEYWKTFSLIKKYYQDDRLKGDEGVKARKYCKKIYQDEAEVKNNVIDEYCFKCYDLPFILLTMKSRGEYMNCKGFWGDDEEKMKEVLIKYGELISGTDMLSHLKSTYSIDTYTKFLDRIKGDIDVWYSPSDDWALVLAVTKIREFAREKTVTDLETGMVANGFKEKL